MKHSFFHFKSLCFCVFLLIAPSAFSRTLSQSPTQVRSPKGPLEVRSQNPLYLHFLSMPLESVDTISSHDFAFDFNLTYTNLFEYKPSAAEFIFMDMELWRMGLRGTYGLTDKFDVAFDVGLVSQAGGFLDGLIEGYHDVFGFPNGGRNLELQNEFEFSLTKNGRTLFDYPKKRLAFGDTSLRFKYKLWPNKEKFLDLAFAFYLKLPTGSAKSGIGSGHTDLGASVLLQKQVSRFAFYSQVGGVFLGGHKFLEDHTRSFFIQAAQNFEWLAFKNFSFLVQLNGQSSAFKGFESKTLKKMILDLTIGASGFAPLKFYKGKTLHYAFGLSEDVLSFGPSVDFSVYTQWGLTF